MKKLIIFTIAIFVLLVTLYKLDIKPEVKDVRKEIQNDRLN